MAAMTAEHSDGVGREREANDLRATAIDTFRTGQQAFVANLDEAKKTAILAATEDAIEWMMSPGQSLAEYWVGMAVTDFAAVRGYVMAHYRRDWRTA